MKWFFALNENSPGFWDYANLIQVAVHSARCHTTLAPVCIFDGGESRLTAWLRAAGVTIVFRRSLLLSFGLPMSAIARGAYLRLEIPSLMRERGWHDNYVLYTDCDVLFQNDPVPALRALQPRYFAVAPESDPSDHDNFNSGVMLINVDALAAEVDSLVTLVRSRPDICLSAPYDQRALHLHFAGRVDRLPSELNWKSYWPSNPRAAIVHFHGPKPAQRFLVLNHQVPADLLACASRTYFEWCRIWDDLLLDSLGTHPWPPSLAPESVPEGFSGLSDRTEGLGPEEGPFPQWLLPVVRWGLAPRTQFHLQAKAPGTQHLSFIAQCPYADQVMHVSLNNVRIRSVPFARVSEPVALRVPLALRAGENVLTFEYDRSFPQEGDARPLAVLFRAFHLSVG